MSSADNLKLHYRSSLVPDQEQQNVVSNLDPNHIFLHSDSVPERILWKSHFEKSQQTTTKAWNITQGAKS